MHSKKNPKLNLLYLLIFFITLCGCGTDTNISSQSSDKNNEYGNATFGLKWENPQHPDNMSLRAKGEAISELSYAPIDCTAIGVSTVSANVYDSGGTYITSGGPWNCSAHSGTITGISAGINRMITVSGKDSSNKIIYNGQITGVTINKDQTTNAGQITMSYVANDTTAPTDGTLSASAGNQQVSLNWSGFSDSGSGIGSYKLVYTTTSSPLSCSSGTQIFTGTGTSYTHTGLTNGTTYYYRICATDNAGNTSSGATASGTPASSGGTTTTTTTTGTTTTGTTTTTTTTTAIADATLLGSYATNIQAWDVALSSNGVKAYVAGWAGYNSFQIIDVSNPSSPSLLGSLNTQYSNDQVAISSNGTKAYISSVSGGEFKIIDISNSSSPTVIGTYSGGRYFAISSDELTVYLAGGNFKIIDISNPASPSLLSTYDVNTNCTIDGSSASSGNCEPVGIAISSDGTKAYIASDWSGVKILDISNKTSPSLLGSFDTSTGTTRGSVYNVTLSSDGTKLYVTGSGGTRSGINIPSLRILDVSNPASPSLLGQSSWYTDDYGKLIIKGTKAYAGGTNRGMHIIDISNPSSPSLIGRFYEVINSTAPQTTGVVLSSDGSKAYISEGVNGLRIVNISGI